MFLSLLLLFPFINLSNQTGSDRIQIQYSMTTTAKDFVILSDLGKGSYSSVYKVKRISDGKEYALKKVRLLALKDKEKSNALNEVRILASISNEYIISYKEAFLEESTNSLCIIMEFANGGDLQQKIDKITRKKTHFAESEVWKIAKDTLNGLKVLHDMKIVHRDIKTANIFISDGRYKLGDLNVSKILEKGLAYTQTGTPYYASPEVWRDQPYDSKSDIWSLGCVLFEICSLRPPFMAKDMQGLFKKIQSGKFERIPNRYTQDLHKFIESCLQLNPLKRPSCEELLKNPYIVSLNQQQNLEQNNLLNTILVPKNLQRLKSLLPKSKYQQTETTTERIPSRRSDLEVHREAPSLMNIRKNQSEKQILPEIILSKYPRPKGISHDSKHLLRAREEGSYEFVSNSKLEARGPNLMKERISALAKLERMNEEIESKLIIHERSLVGGLVRRDYSNSDRYKQPSTNPVKLPHIEIKQRPAALSLKTDNPNNDRNRPEWWG